MKPSLPNLILASIFSFGAGSISAQAESGTPPQSETNLIVYGDDPCPRAEDPDEIVVCARQPEDERYRIPSRLRSLPDHLTATSWASRVATLEEAARPMRPNSCSVVGTGGQTGCTEAMIRQWFAERRLDAAIGGYAP